MDLISKQSIGIVLTDFNSPFLNKLYFLLFFSLSIPIPNSSPIWTPTRKGAVPVRMAASAGQGPPLGLTWNSTLDRGSTHDTGQSPHFLSVRPHAESASRFCCHLEEEQLQVELPRF